MRSESLPNGDIQCLLGKPWTISIGSEVCTQSHTGALPWAMAIEVANEGEVH
jgi:hypothetical protein